MRPTFNIADACFPGEHYAAAPRYWGRPEASRAIFAATLADTGEGPFLRTGDLGFLRDDQLYITGRLKDVVVIRGRNLWPQDVQHTVMGSHAAVRPGGVAAFAVQGPDGEEGLGIVAEVRGGDLPRAPGGDLRRHRRRSKAVARGGDRADPPQQGRPPTPVRMRAFVSKRLATRSEV